MDNSSGKSSISLKRMILEGLVLDAFLLFIASAIMDGGVIFSITLCMTAGHWFGNCVILIRRKNKLTKYDRLFIRFGLLMIVVMTVWIWIL